MVAAAGERKAGECHILFMVPADEKAWRCLANFAMPHAGVPGVRYSVSLVKTSCGNLVRARLEGGQFSLLLPSPSPQPAAAASSGAGRGLHAGVVDYERMTYEERRGVDPTYFALPLAASVA